MIQNADPTGETASDPTQLSTLEGAYYSIASTSQVFKIAIFLNFAKVCNFLLSQEVRNVLST